jgi:hypothetical protein
VQHLVIAFHLKSTQEWTIGENRNAKLAPPFLGGMESLEIVRKDFP